MLIAPSIRLIRTRILPVFLEPTVGLRIDFGKLGLLATLSWSGATDGVGGAAGGVAADAGIGLRLHDNRWMS